MAKHRWVILEFIGNGRADSLEGVLHSMGKPFLVGNHALDDPDIARRREIMAERQAALAAARRSEAKLRAKAARTGKAFVETATPEMQALAMVDDQFLALGPEPLTRVESVAAPAGGKFEHLCWAYFNKKFNGHGHLLTLWQAADSILRLDSAVKLLVYASNGHGELVELFDELERKHPGRYVTVFHRRNFQGHFNPPPQDRLAVEGDDTWPFVLCEDELARRADLLFVSPTLRYGPRHVRSVYRDWLARMDRPVVEQSCVYSPQRIDWLIEQAEGVLARRSVKALGEAGL